MSQDRSHFLRNLWRWSCGLPEDDGSNPSLEELRRTEWSPSFEGHMRAALLMGWRRYGRLKGQFKPPWDRLRDIRIRLEAYERTGNLALLVDIANMALLEFVEGKHPLAHFESAQEADHHTVVSEDRRLGRIDASGLDRDRVANMGITAPAQLSASAPDFDAAVFGQVPDSNRKKGEDR